MMYTIIKRADESKFEDDVNTFLKDGWICQGGVSVCVDASFGYEIFRQAMVREDK